MVVDITEFTSIQKKILKIWQDSIKTKTIGLNDNFFDAGGTSLLAIWVVDKIEKEFNISLSLRMFFDSPKIQSLSEIVDIKMNTLKTSERKHPDLNIKNDEKIIKGEL
jgi:acyl carrier protein